MGNTFEKFARFLHSTGWELVRGDKLSPARNHAEISARKSFKTYRFP